MENPRTKAKRARKQRKEKEEEIAATGPGHPAQPGHPDPAYPESSEAGHSSPDIRHLTKARTSGPTPGHPAPPCLRAAHLGRGPCTPSSLRLYILLHLLLVRVSVDLAQVRDRASLIHRISSS